MINAFKIATVVFVVIIVVASVASLYVNAMIDIDNSNLHWIIRWMLLIIVSFIFVFVVVLCLVYFEDIKELIRRFICGN